MKKTFFALLVPASMLLGAARPQAEPVHEVFLPFTLSAEREIGLAIEVDAGGRIRADRKVRFEPGGDREKLEGWLAERAKGMATARNGVIGADLPDERVLMRVDMNAPFSAVQKLMQSCAMPDVQLWKIEFATRLANDGGAGFIPVHLPIDDAPVEELEEGVEPSVEPVEKLEIRIDVITQGERRSMADLERPWEGEGPYLYVGRVIQYRVGPYKSQSLDDVAKRCRKLREGIGTRSLRVDARGGTTYGEVVELLDVALEVGCERFSFTGTFD